MVVVVFEQDVETSLTAQVGRLAMVHYDPSAEHGGDRNIEQHKRQSWRKE